MDKSGYQKHVISDGPLGRGYLNDNNDFVGVGDGGSSGDSGVFNEIKMSQSDIDLLKSLDPSKIDQKEFTDQALAELTPYYQRLIDEAGGDINLAKQRLEEDYKTGMRQKREDISSDLKTLFTQTFPQEQKSTLEDLNRRGLLGGVANVNQPSETVTAVNQLTDTGTATVPNADIAGKPITAEYNPNIVSENVGNFTQKNPTVAAFTGLAGKTIATQKEGQDARKEAIVRAFTRYNEDANLKRSRDIQDTALTGARNIRDLTQEKAEKVPQLAASKYAEAVNKNQLKRQSILEPYQLKASGISGY